MLALELCARYRQKLIEILVPKLCAEYIKAALKQKFKHLITSSNLLNLNVKPMINIIP